MEYKAQFGKSIVISVFILAAVVIMTNISYHQIFAAPSSSAGNHSGALNPSGPLTPYGPGPHSNSGINTPFNSTKLNPNDTETIQSFTALNGNNSQFFTKDKSVSNPNNTIASSEGTNYYQNH
ncbi:MAG TPA: hypothetical protein VN704_06250 [Verrucomicrobiae bacterium]|nr:hypothetical protein [Verrucomicrobiae bacterium]